MGTDVRIVAVGVDPEAVDEARSVVADRESRWSRFLPDSEISGINSAPGVWHRVAPDTFRLIEAAVSAPHPFAAAVLATFALKAGAVVTSTRVRRQWTVDGDGRHHLIDPRTARPAASGLASVTIVGADAMWSEVLAKAVFVAGLEAGAELVERVGGTGLAVADDGAVLTLPSGEDFLA